MSLLVRLLLVLCVVLRAGPSLAGELYSIFDAACQRQSGVLLRVDATHVVLVDLEGRVIKQERSRISSVVLHTLLESPLGEIHIDDALAPYLRRIWVGTDKEPTFTGWATAFYDDLVIFVDLDGKTHVLSPEEIRRVGLVAQRGTRPAAAPPARPALAFPPEVVPCASEAVPDGAVPPSHVIADRIKLDDHFAKLEEHYLALDGFEERTKVYAHPFVFDPASRVGLLYFEDMELPIPFYFRWSSGRAYRFQSLLVVGNSPHEWLPVVGPTLSLRSDVKSHFFSASFVGNLVALPAGSDAFILSRLNRNRTPPSEMKLDTSYNYLMLLGADYWRFSLAVGPAYLATRIQVPMQPTRAAQADQASPTVRLRYQSENLELRALYYRTRLDGTLASNEDVPFATGMGSARVKYHQGADTVRAGGTWKPFPSIELALDEVVAVGDYSESMNPMGAALTPLSLSYLQALTSGMIAADFGRYITVKAYGILTYARNQAPGLAAANNSGWDARFGGALEFVF